MSEPQDMDLLDAELEAEEDDQVNEEQEESDDTFDGEEGLALGADDEVDDTQE